MLFPFNSGNVALCGAFALFFDILGKGDGKRLKAPAVAVLWRGKSGVVKTMADKEGQSGGKDSLSGPFISAVGVAYL